MRERVFANRFSLRVRAETSGIAVRPIRCHHELLRAYFSGALDSSFSA
jgi:hypothetical protein